MPGPRAAQNLQIPLPGTDKAGKCSAVALGGEGGGGGEWAQLELTDALFLTDDEALTIVGNAHCVIPENLVFKKTTEKSRREIIQDVLSNDPRNKHEQVWT